jgi:hypothetical protein
MSDRIGLLECSAPRRLHRKTVALAHPHLSPSFGWLSDGRSFRPRLLSGLPVRF